MSREYFINGKYDPDGSETDIVAKQYAKDNGVDYGTAINAVQRNARNAHAEKIASADKTLKYSENGGWKIYADANGNVVEARLDGAGDALTKLSNIVSGLPRLPDHSIDADTAAQVINASFGELGRNASGGFLSAVALKHVGNAPANTPEAATDNPFSSMFTAGFDMAVREYPAVAAVYNGAAMSSDALRQILWPLFRDPQRFAKRDSAHKYASSDQGGKVYHDGVGEVHRN